MTPSTNDSLARAELGIPCDMSDERVKVGRRYVRRPKYELAKRLRDLGFEAYSNNTNWLHVGDEITITRVPSPIHNASLGVWEIVSFFGPTAQAVRVPA